MSENNRVRILRDDNKFCSWGDTTHYNDPPLVFENCEDQFLFDPEGNVYFDLQMQNSSANFGYKNQSYIKALQDQLERLPQLASEYLTAEKVLLCKEIAQSVYKRWKINGRVHLNVGGAQAIDDSLKVVASNKHTRRVYAFEGAYHGRTIGASAITASYRYRSRYGEFNNRAHFIPYPYCFRCPYGKKRENCNLFCLKQFERLFESECQGHIDFRDGKTEYAAFYVEPVQGTGGYICPPKEYLENLSKILKKYGILFISDEIQMGIYRTGKLWALEHFNVEPDIIAFGKSLTNGLNPLSGIWAREELISPVKFPPGSTHSTYGSNPMGCRLGLTTFRLNANRALEHHVKEMGDYFLEGLRYLKNKHSSIGDVDGLGLALRIEVCEDDGLTPSFQRAKKLRVSAATSEFKTNMGVMRLILGIGGYHKNVFTLSPALTLNRSDVDRAILMLDTLFYRI